MERHLRGVKLVVRAGHELYLYVHDRVPGHDTVIERIPDASVHARDVLPGDDAADDLVLELVAALVVVLEVDDGVPVLTATAGLPDETSLDVLDPAPHGLPVSDLRLAEVGVHLELPEEPVQDDLQVQLAHPGDDRL